MLKLSLLCKVMSLLERHPHLARTFLSPLANAPIISRRLPVLMRAFMGATAFEIHEVDASRGRISIGGVDEIIFSSKFMQLFHQEIGAAVGPEAKKAILYRVGRAGTYWEASEALSQGRWGPGPLVAVIEQAKTRRALQDDPIMSQFFELIMNMTLRLIINEGGWGASQMDLSASPMRVYLANSQEAKWLGPADHPVCDMTAGSVAGYASRILGEELQSREVECSAMGASRCVFEIYQQ